MKICPKCCEYIKKDATVCEICNQRDAKVQKEIGIGFLTAGQEHILV